MNLALVVTCWLAAAVAAWSWSPGSFRGARVWSKNKRNLASFKNKFGYRGETRDKRGMMKHPVMFARDSRFLIFLAYVSQVSILLLSGCPHSILISEARPCSITM